MAEERWVKANRLFEEMEGKPSKVVYVDMIMVDEIIPYTHSNGDTGTKLRSNVMDAIFDQEPQHFLPNDHPDYKAGVINDSNTAT